ncbi:hypothetical protein [Bifidobacterium pseudocatenulatum]|jgi:hypothetical protein|uniref:hypothetical protein n=1 Tax=Bifidobacterium pseudocatenulatum TaxID=28026 RepID=UPI0032192A3F
MITREFDYTADEFDAEQPVQMATLDWNTVDNDGYYHHHSLRMEHHSGDGFKAAKREALAIMGKDYPNATLKVREPYHNGRFYAAFLIDASDNE